MQRLPTYFRVLLVVMGLVHLGRMSAFVGSLLSKANGPIKVCSNAAKRDDV